MGQEFFFADLIFILELLHCQESDGNEAEAHRDDIMGEDSVLFEWEEHNNTLSRVMQDEDRCQAEQILHGAVEQDLTAQAQEASDDDFGSQVRVDVEDVNILAVAVHEKHQATECVFEVNHLIDSDVGIQEQVLDELQQ